MIRSGEIKMRETKKNQRQTRAANELRRIAQGTLFVWWWKQHFWNQFTKIFIVCLMFDVVSLLSSPFARCCLVPLFFLSATIKSLMELILNSFALFAHSRDCVLFFARLCHLKIRKILFLLWVILRETFPWNYDSTCNRKMMFKSLITLLNTVIKSLQKLDEKHFFFWNLFFNV